MNLGQAFKIAIKSISAKKSRSILTMLGVIIGVAAVIVLVSYAQGQNLWMQEYYASMADNSIEIYAYSYNKDLSTPLYNYCLQLDDYVVGVTPTAQVWSTVLVRHGAKSLNSDDYENWDDRPEIVLGGQDYSICKAYTLTAGRDLSYLDIKNENQVCVLGSHMAELLFDYTNPVGKTISINSQPFEVVGVYESKDAAFSMGSLGYDKIILVPYTLNRTLNNNQSLDSFVIKAKDATSTKRAITLLSSFLEGAVGDYGYYSISTPDQWKEMGEEEQQVQQRFLGGIAAISLAVGGIGIMNIMLVTVTERTREIGIRKAIGAERRSIVAQFLIEACMLCGFGGLLGIVAGFVLTLIVGKQSFGIILIPNPGVTLGAVLISLALGVIFGLYPAIKASGLQPVDALRAE